MNDLSFDSIDETSLDTVLSVDVEFGGTLSFEKPLMIKGRVSGQIESTSDLYVDEKAVVEASIRARRVYVRGYVKGNVSAEVSVDLYASSRVEGDISAPEVTMETGCAYNGICMMTGTKSR
jgi:cytoskeletal protein CcmA (bactofilin family)